MTSFSGARAVAVHVARICASELIRACAWIFKMVGVGGLRVATPLYRFADWVEGR